jgi:hypothetical protein
LPSELCLVAERDLDRVGKTSLGLCTFARELQEVSLAHVEIQVDGIQRDEGRQQCRRTGPGTAAGNQVAHGDKMLTDATGERRGDVAMIEVEPSIADLGLGIVHGGLRGSLFGRALVDVLRRAKIASLQGLSTIELALGEH